MANAGTSGTPAAADGRLAAVVAVLEQQMATLGIPAAALGILKDGVVELRTFGVTNVEHPLPVDEGTLFNIASLSKTVTATAAMSLVEQGKLDLDAPLRTWLPGWHVGDEGSSRAILLRHLLTHATGLNGIATTEPLGVLTLTRFAESMGGLVRLAPPGAIWSYFNAGYALCGRLIEVATGTDIHRALRRLVFDPLGLDTASTRLDEIVTRSVAVGHTPGAGGDPVVVRPFAMGSSIPSGGVAMSIADLMRYAAFHLNEGEAGAAQIIAPETRALMRTPQIAKAPTDDWMGIGWHLRRVGGVLTAAHGGSAPAGHRLLLELVPDRRLAFAILTNHTDGWRLNQKVEHAILAAYEGLALAPNQRIAFRGQEDFSLHATPLEQQPDPVQYAGSYLRGPAKRIEVRADGNRLTLGGTILNFYGPDLAFGAKDGAPTEFIRDESGHVVWIRHNGSGLGRRAATEGSSGDPAALR